MEGGDKMDKRLHLGKAERGERGALYRNETHQMTCRERKPKEKNISLGEKCVRRRKVEQKPGKGRGHRGKEGSGRGKPKSRRLRGSSLDRVKRVGNQE